MTIILASRERVVALDWSCNIAAIPGQVLPQRVPVARREGALATQRWTIFRAPDN